MSASSAGIAERRNTVRSGTCIHVSAAKPMSGPSTAPALSLALWNPNARPRIDGSTESAMSASRGDVRIPFPTRSVMRIAATCVTLWANPISGRTNPASAYPNTTSGFRFAK